MLDGKNFNIVLSELIKNIYGENYKIQFVENISEEKLKEYQAHLESLEEQVVNIAKAEMVEAAGSKKSEKKVSNAANENNNSTNVEQGVAKPVESINEKAEEEYNKSSYIW